MTIDQATSPDEPLENAIAFRITRVSRILRLQLIRFLRDCGLSLSPEQYLLLFRVVDHPGQSLSDLADAVLEDRPNVTRLVDGLERADLVERRSDPTDRRRQRLHPTASGMDAIATVRDQLGEERAAVVADVDPADFEVFSRVLGQIEAAAARRAAP